MSLLIIPLWFGRLHIKHNRFSLFSERNGFVPSFALFGVRFTWRRYGSLL